MRAIAVQENIRDLILDAADRLLARYGYRKMTIDDLAAEVGIGKGSIYLHFRSKEEVVYSHIDRVIVRFDSVQHFPESLADMFRDLRPGIYRHRQNHFKQEQILFATTLQEGQ